MRAGIAASGGDGRVRKRRGDGPMRFRTSFKNTVSDVLKSRPGWVETESETDWDFQWAERDWVYDTFDSMHLDPWQRMNHFRNGRELCRKDLLAKNIKRTRRQLEKDGKLEEAAKYDFAPITFILPGDYALFVEEFKKPVHAGATWIMKPIARSQGKGIFLFNKLAQIQQWKSDYRWKPENAAVEAYVVQKYLANPYLIGGKKFDLRVYALVTSYAPLTVWVYRTGFTRFSASRYTNDAYDSFVHLTNVAVQKTSSDYNPDFGGKWEIGRLKMYMASKHGWDATNKLFAEIQDILLYALLSVAKIIINDVHCFELYGYDILIDDTLKPWLLEVNASPSMTASTRDDYDLKFKLLNDTLDVVDMEGRLTGAEEHIGGFDLVWKDGPVTLRGGPDSFIGGAGPAGPIATPALMVPPPGGGGMYSTMMGAEFDRHINVFKTPGRTGLSAAVPPATASNSLSVATGAAAAPAASAGGADGSMGRTPMSSPLHIATAGPRGLPPGTVLPPASGASPMASAATGTASPALAGSAAFARRSSSYGHGRPLVLPAAAGASGSSQVPTGSASASATRPASVSATEPRGRSSSDAPEVGIAMPAVAAGGGLQPAPSTGSTTRTRPTMSAHASRQPAVAAIRGAAASERAK